MNFRNASDQPVGKKYFAGTHRAVAPEVTWERIAPLFARFGITRVADITGLDRIGLPVAVAIRPLARSVVVAAGKGVSLVAAKVSAAMESLECAHAENPLRPLTYASRAELGAAGRASVPLASLPRLTGAGVGDDTRIVWTEGVAVGSSEPMLVPYELVHAHYGPHGLAGTGIFQATTNGLSSGNTFAEAVCHGLFEVIERDALNLWERRGREGREATRLAPVLEGAGEVPRMLERLRERGLRVALWNITSDLGVSAFHSIIVDDADPGGHPGTGTGCHADAAVALSRAITEAVQVRATYISGGRDDLFRHEYAERSMAWFRRLADDNGAAPPVAFEAIESRVSARFEDDIEWVSARVAKAGCGPIVVVDLSQPDTGIHVVRVIVPGLEGPPGGELAAGERARAIAR